MPGTTTSVGCGVVIVTPAGIWIVDVVAVAEGQLQHLAGNAAL
jgi:hypothetical protein